MSVQLLWFKLRATHRTILAAGLAVCIVARKVPAQSAICTASSDSDRFNFQRVNRIWAGLASFPIDFQPHSQFPTGQ